MGSWFEANRDGTCSRCKGEVSQGDRMFAKGKGIYYCAGCGLIAEDDAQEMGAVETSVMHDIRRLPPEAEQSVIAQQMIYMARQLDEHDVGPREVPNYTKELRLNLMQLKDEFPEKEDDDPTTAARDARERRMREQHGI